jgi:hypothetical protein
MAWIDENGYLHGLPDGVLPLKTTMKNPKQRPDVKVETPTPFTPVPKIPEPEVKS